MLIAVETLLRRTDRYNQACTALHRDSSHSAARKGRLSPVQFAGQRSTNEQPAFRLTLSQKADRHNGAGLLAKTGNLRLTPAIHDPGNTSMELVLPRMGCKPGVSLPSVSSERINSSTVHCNDCERVNTRGLGFLFDFVRNFLACGVYYRWQQLLLGSRTGMTEPNLIGAYVLKCIERVAHPRRFDKRCIAASDRDDILQECRIRLFGRIKEFKCQGEVPSVQHLELAGLIVHGEIIRHLKKKRRSISLISDIEVEDFRGREKQVAEFPTILSKCNAVLTCEEIDLLNRIAAGETQQSIAEALGRNPGTISRWLRDTLVRMRAYVTCS